jgi:NADPH2:quinone reductase
VQTVAAIVVRRFGGPEVLEPTGLELPSPSPGRVAIEVELAGITFVETQLRAGRAPRPEMMPRLPWVPGNGVAGTVTELGDGADPALLGTRIVSTTGGSGGYAGRVEVDAEAPIAVPEELALDAATALLADGRTAIRLAAAAAIRDGERVLVEAAAGGVGSLLVQLARGAGATVVAAASEPRKLAVAAELGAAETVDYSRPDWSDRIEPVDVVFDGVGGEIGAAAFSLLRPGGRYVPFGAAGGAFGPVDADHAEQRGVAVSTSPPPDPAEMRRLVEHGFAEATHGRLRPLIGQRLPLAEAAEAHRAIEARETIGKTLLVP